MLRHETVWNHVWRKESDFTTFGEYSEIPVLQISTCNESTGFSKQYKILVILIFLQKKKKNNV